MFALLLPILASVLPEIGKLVFGSTGETVTTEAMNIVKAITGKDDPSPADLSTAISDPKVEADLRIQLSKIAAEQEKAKEDAAIAREEQHLNEMRALLADVSNARNQTIELAKTGSYMAWGAPVISMIVMISFGIVTYLLMTHSVNTNEATMLIVGALISMAQGVVSYWVGSSLGSATKQNQLDNVIRKIGK